MGIATAEAVPTTWVAIGYDQYTLSTSIAIVDLHNPCRRGLTDIMPQLVGTKNESPSVGCYSKPPIEFFVMFSIVSTRGMGVSSEESTIPLHPFAPPQDNHFMQAGTQTTLHHRAAGCMQSWSSRKKASYEAASLPRVALLFFPTVLHSHCRWQPSYRDYILSHGTGCSPLFIPG